MGDSVLTELSLFRKIFTKKSTIGELRKTNGDLISYTLEDAVRSGSDNVLQAAEKIQDKTAIPTGRYEVVLTYSTRFKQVMPQLLGVNFFDGIRIHRGNTDADTAGCILLGISVDTDRILGSESAYGKVANYLCDSVIRGSRVFLNVAGNPPPGFWGGAM